MIFFLTTPQGCSVFKAVNSPPPVDVVRVKTGETRQTIITVLGPPTSSEIKEDGRADVYEFIDGYSQSEKEKKILLYTCADYLTLGLAELYFYPREQESSKGIAGRAVVDYDKDNMARSVHVTRADGQPWQYPAKVPDDSPPVPLLERLSPPSIEPLSITPPDGRIALVFEGDVDAELDIPGSSGFAASGKGASQGATMGASLGVICYYAIIICSPVFGATGGIIGSVAGPIAAEPSSTWKEAGKAYSTTLSGSDAKAQLLQKIVSIADDYGYDVFLPANIAVQNVRELQPNSTSRQEEIAGILEISNVSVDFDPVEFAVNPLRRITPRARVRMIRVADKAVVVDRIIADESGSARPVTAWMADDAKLLRHEMAEAWPRLADAVVTELFLLRPIKIRRVSDGLVYEIVIDGLKPVDPQIQTDISHRNLPVTVTGLAPTLRWESLPGDNVTYDLRIWKATGAVGGHPGEVVCNKENLVVPAYTVESGLEALQPYYWSVRARFEIDGMPRLTQWSRVSMKNSEASKILTLGAVSLMPDPMSNQYYKFVPTGCK